MVDRSVNRWATQKLMFKPFREYQRIAVFGAGVSGRSARKLAIGLGFNVRLFDEGGQGDASEFNEALLCNFDAFVFSPGFAANHPWRFLVESSSKPCYSELGFAASHWRGRLIGVTGTNGKTSLTSLLFRGLKAAKVEAVEAGNIGIPLSDFVLNDVNTDETYAVCEISSFQAELVRGLQLDGLIWTNFAEDHLERHASMNDYFSAKRNLIKCLRFSAPALVGKSVQDFDDSLSKVANVFVVDEDSALIRQLASGSPFKIPPQSNNFVLAASLWQHLQLPADSLVESANLFQLGEHRLNCFARWGGVSFWNDSKATNFHAALAAMDALKGSIYWIGGGSFKGGDLGKFAESVAKKVRTAFLYGAVAEELADHFLQTDCPFEVHSSFQDVVQAAAGAALKDKPSSLLLSPGFASFDQFSGYAARGNAFLSSILKLKDNYCPD